MATAKKIRLADGTEVELGGGTTVVANPTLSGSEAELTGLEVAGTKYKVPQGGGGGGTIFAYWGKSSQNDTGEIEVVESTATSTIGNVVNSLGANAFSNTLLTDTNQMNSLLSNGKLVFLCRYGDMESNAVYTTHATHFRAANGVIYASVIIDLYEKGEGFELGYSIAGITE